MANVFYVHFGKESNAVSLYIGMTIKEILLNLIERYILARMSKIQIKM